MADVEKELFRADTTEEEKVEALRVCCTGETLDIVLDVLEKDAGDYVRRHSGEDKRLYLDRANEDDGWCRFATPTKQKPYYYRRENPPPPYVPVYSDLKRKCIERILGVSALMDLQTSLDTFKQDAATSVASHIAAFKTRLETYMLAAGLDSSAHLGTPQCSTWFYRSLRDDIKREITQFDMNLTGAYALAEDAESRVKMRSALLSSPSSLRFPSSSTGQGARPSLCNVNAQRTGTAPPRQVASAVQVFTRGLSRADSVEKAVGEVCLFYDQAHANRRYIDRDGVLLEDADRTFNVSRFVGALQRDLESCHDQYESVAAIQHLLPDRFVKETTRSTTTTTEHSLKGLSSQQLAKLRARKRSLDRSQGEFGAPSDSDEVDEPSPEPASKQLHTRTRAGRKKAAAVEQVAAVDVALRAQAAAFRLGIEAASSSPEKCVRFEEQVAAFAPPVSGVSPNKNTPSNRSERPWVKDRSWRGCRRCWDPSHRHTSCPPVLEGKARFCAYCNEDGHILEECPALREKKCNTCGKPGHTALFCPTQTCYKCGVKGHSATRCKQKNA
jgi:hypothetical protein